MRDVFYEIVLCLSSEMKRGALQCIFVGWKGIKYVRLLVLSCDSLSIETQGIILKIDYNFK